MAQSPETAMMRPRALIPNMQTQTNVKRAAKARMRLASNPPKRESAKPLPWI
jgi:hypothetical protein